MNGWRFNISQAGEKELELLLRQAQDRVGHAVAREYSRGVGIETGELRDSIGYLRPGGSDTGYIHTNVFYARFHEFGTRAHVIRPRGGGGLFWPGLNRPVKKVNHPGTKANRAFLRAVLKKYGVAA